MVTEEDRVDFFPKHCARAFLMFESHVYFNEEMSADAAGIVVTLFTLSHMAERVPSLADRYYDLMEYIDCHPEAGKIYAAID